MSLISMVAMELVENLIDYNLTGGVVAFHDPKFWAAAILSAAGGFLAPLPYNYFKLQRFGKSCH
jgi:tetrahydromethanopterin S-methyltransferase subunit D